MPEDSVQSSDPLFFSITKPSLTQPFQLDMQFNSKSHPFFLYICLPRHLNGFIHLCAPLHLAAFNAP